MARVATPLNAMANVMKVIEMPPNVTTRLVDLLVGVGVGVAWWLTRVDDVVASRPPLKIGATILEMTWARSLGLSPPWGVGWSLIFMVLDDLDRCRFECGGGLSDL